MAYNSKYTGAQVEAILDKADGMVATTMKRIYHTGNSSYLPWINISGNPLTEVTLAPDEHHVVAFAKTVKINLPEDAWRDDKEYRCSIIACSNVDLNKGSYKDEDGDLLNTYGASNIGTSGFLLTLPSWVKLINLNELKNQVSAYRTDLSIVNGICRQLNTPNFTISSPVVATRGTLPAGGVQLTTDSMLTIIWNGKNEIPADSWQAGSLPDDTVLFSLGGQKGGDAKDLIKVTMSRTENTEYDESGDTLLYTYYTYRLKVTAFGTTKGISINDDTNSEPDSDGNYVNSIHKFVVKILMYKNTEGSIILGVNVQGFYSYLDENNSLNYDGVASDSLMDDNYINLQFSYEVEGYPEAITTMEVNSQMYDATAPTSGDDLYTGLEISKVSF